MSVENVKAFFEKVAEDEALQEKLKALAEREEAVYADLVKIASAAASSSPRRMRAEPLSPRLSPLRCWRQNSPQAAGPVSAVTRTVGLMSL